jgi:hypothetical protein
MWKGATDKNKVSFNLYNAHSAVIWLTFFSLAIFHCIGRKDLAKSNMVWLGQCQS